MEKATNQERVPPWGWWLLWGIFLLSRIIIWIYRPVDFTEIIYSYMPYSHLWASGTKPYLEQWYEYPPATIPLFYVPHLIDQATLETHFHVNYLQAYRGILLGVDCLIFGLIVYVLKRFKTGVSHTVIVAFYYIGATLKAHDFIYDSMDLIFAALILFGLVAILFRSRYNHFYFWLGYFGATAMKLINAPLFIPYLAGQRYRWVTIPGMIVAGVIVWFIPISYFRSSLLTMLMYHQQRGLQVESMPARLADTISRFSKTEHYVEKYKNYEISGPVSGTVKQVADIFFPMCLIFYTAWFTYGVWRLPRENFFSHAIYGTFGYLLLFMLTGKVLSTPFFLWHIPLVAALPTINIKSKLFYLIPSIILVTLNMTFIPNWQVGIFVVHIYRSWVNFGLLLWLFSLTFNDMNKKMYLRVEIW